MKKERTKENKILIAYMIVLLIVGFLSLITPEFTSLSVIHTLMNMGFFVLLLVYAIKDFKDPEKSKAMTVVGIVLCSAVIMKYIYQAVMIFI